MSETEPSVVPDDQHDGSDDAAGSASHGDGRRPGQRMLTLVLAVLLVIVAVAGIRAVAQRVGRTMRAAALFTVGFGVTFTALGASASWLGAALLASRPSLVRAAGVLVVAVGVLTVAGAEPRVLARERRLVALHRVPRGPLFAAPLGAAFALGWTPCIGPVLAGLLAAAAASPTVAAGAGLLGVYTAGLAVPFLLLAWAVARGRGHGGGAAGLLGRHQPLLARVGGTLLAAMGLAMLVGWWTQMFAPLLRWFARSGWTPIWKGPECSCVPAITGPARPSPSCWPARRYWPPARHPAPGRPAARTEPRPQPGLRPTPSISRWPASPAGPGSTCLMTSAGGRWCSTSGHPGAALPPGDARAPAGLPQGQGPGELPVPVDAGRGPGRG